MAEIARTITAPVKEQNASRIIFRPPSRQRHGVFIFPKVRYPERMHKKAVVIFGPPGAGKGTQANLLAWTRGFVHFDTGRHMERVVHDPARQNDPIIARERELWESGKLNTPGWALELVTVETRTIGR